MTRENSDRIYRLGVIGFAHMNVNELVSQFVAHDQVQLVAIADTVPKIPSLLDIEGSRIANLRKTLNTESKPRQYQDYIEMIDKENLDIAIFCPEIFRHVEIAEALAARGIHMVTEKPMAATLTDALSMVRAARLANVALMVNWPITWKPWILIVKDLIERDEIGQPWEVKWRNGPSLGPLPTGGYNLSNTVLKNEPSEKEKAAEWWYQADVGGGALLDHCCYGACLSSWYLEQQAVATQGLKANLLSPYSNAEDNAAMLVQFPKGIAIIEGSWTTYHTGVPSGPIVFGSKGTIVVDGNQAMVFNERGETEPSSVHRGQMFPDWRSNIAQQFLRFIEQGEKPHPTLDIPLNINTSAIIDAGIKSAESGKLEMVQTPPWSIG